MPVMVTLPEPVDEILAESCRKTPMELVPVPHEVPLIVRLPELVVAAEEVIITPRAKSVPLAAVPVIVTLPKPVDETLAEVSKTPLEVVPVPQEVPLIVRLPVLVLAEEELIYTP